MVVTSAWGNVVGGLAGNAHAVAKDNGVYANENYRNAIEHAHVSAEIAYDYGETVAETLRNMKEWTSNDPEDSARDQWNNKVGRQIADYARDHGLTKNDLDHLTNGCAQERAPEDGSGSSDSPSDSQTTMLDPSSANGVSLMLQDLAQVAPGVLRA